MIMNAQNTLPVYLFTGFLEAGKTKFIQESLEDKKFNSGDKILLLVCEEGIEEYDPSRFFGQNVYLSQIESEEALTKEALEKIAKEHIYDRIIIEYNGMWQLQTLYASMPSDWAIFQQMLFIDSETFSSYNANMRQLIFDKLLDAEIVVFNRADSKKCNKEDFHKIVRGVNRRAVIVYDYPDGKIEYDNVEDPLPFDKNADVIEIDDRDYALWYRDLSEDLSSYIGKRVKFKGIVARSEQLDDRSFIIGRAIMSCCEDDIAYSGLVCRLPEKTSIKHGEWVGVIAEIKYEDCALYGKKGPVLYADKTSFATKPEPEVATFY